MPLFDQIAEEKAVCKLSWISYFGGLAMRIGDSIELNQPILRRQADVGKVGFASKLL
ncbi:hypothetical protein PICMEDRAFT_16081 [Pichia membranifaciens NRRL Y-2026]|uniref:Uncharacterized protein n=1 Tax=Pichia membranifaciens NRRL Y-2026 TaxID=763406 RepID=A0A1E3NRT7_9ASCO|nr:hypothetical protein PICMEDRAFT_16081 [Pichia membranifaciens NRRL Y-2026]ODQ48273.1 hypothetical protein PICMEDRAFT_16081 [Pichia membranifaciens NRRL Y-2026]